MSEKPIELISNDEPEVFELATNEGSRDALSVLDSHLTNPEKKQLIGGDFAAILREWSSKHGNEILGASPCAQTWDGTVIAGPAFIPANLLMKFNRDWVDVFVSDEEMLSLGLTAYPGIRPVYVVDRELSSGDVIYKPYWNLSDTNADKVIPELYSKIRNRFEELSGNMKYVGDGAEYILGHSNRTTFIDATVSNIGSSHPDLVNKGRRQVLNEVFSLLSCLLSGVRKRLSADLEDAGQLSDGEAMYELYREIGSKVNELFRLHPEVKPKTVSVSELQLELANEKEALATARSESKAEGYSPKI